MDGKEVGTTSEIMMVRTKSRECDSERQEKGYAIILKYRDWEKKLSNSLVLQINLSYIIQRLQPQVNMIAKTLTR